MTRTQRTGLAVMIWGVFLLNWSLHETTAWLPVAFALVGAAYTIYGLLNLVRDDDD